MRLNIAKRLRVVTIYCEKNLKYHINKFDALRLEASLEAGASLEPCHHYKSMPLL